MGNLLGKLSAPKLTQQQIQAVELLFEKDEKGLTYQDIADEVGVDIRTLSRWRTENAEFIQLFEKTTTDGVRKLQPATLYRLTDIITNAENYRDSTVIKALELSMKANNMLGTDRLEVAVDDVTNRQKATDILDEFRALGWDIEKAPE